MSVSLPEMIEVRQKYPESPALDFPSLLQQQFETQRLSEKILPGMRIAVGVGSRGITNLQAIVKATLDVLLRAGARPFLIPAMGSHGNATAEGQAGILAKYGVTPETMGVPIAPSMETRKIGVSSDGLDVLFSVPALEADGVVVINRIKPHTDFHGELGSGLQKMLVIGFGKQAGAANAHRAAARFGHERVFRDFARVILGAVPVLFGVGIVEDAHHQTAEVEMIRGENIVSAEARLFQRARSLMPRLPLDEIDLLIIDQIGKEISGTGMDTNIIGREILGYSSTLGTNGAHSPRIFRIFVRDLTSQTYGNAIGIGLADFTTSRLVQQLNLPAMYINALTAVGPQTVKIPMYFDTDREAILQAISSLATTTPESLRVVRILDTLHLERLLVSQPCLASLSQSEGITTAARAQTMQFDETGNLLPF